MNMSTVTVTEITEKMEVDKGDPTPTADIEKAYLVEEVEVDEKGEETDVETDGEIQNLTEGTKKKKKKLRRELSTSQKTRDDSHPQGYSSSEEVEGSKIKRRGNTSATIRRRIVKKTSDEDKARSRRGKSEPKELVQVDESGNTKAKKTWWPFSRSRGDHRQVQTDGETRSKSRRSDESSDEFWKSGSFRAKRKPKEMKAPAKSLEDIKSTIDSALKATVNTATIAKSVKAVSSLVSKEILDEVTVEIIKESPVPAGRPSWRQFKLENAIAWRRIVLSRNRCISSFIAFSIYLGMGAFAIRFIEGAFENFYKCGVKRVKRDFIDSLWERRYANEDEWKSLARRTLHNFENELQTAFEAGMKSYSGQQSWSFINSYMYCLHVVTTIGYGNISPSTNTGRAFTIAYAIFGIPLFLIVLADFGKLFTRGIKFLWAYVRRLYYTGSCRQVRRTAAGAAPVQEVMKGVKMVVDVAQNLRRPSQMISPEEQKKMQGAFGSTLETPGPGCATPALSSYEIDEEFNLPISLALLILLVYIFCGAALFGLWESWSFFESFYFVFISMSTIGFGDVMPQHQMYMMGTIAYLLFGLALTSMCINVVQEKLTDTFRQASAKISATIGFQVEEDSGAINPVPVVPQGDLPEVHKTVKAKKT